MKANIVQRVSFPLATIAFLIHSVNQAVCSTAPPAPTLRESVPHVVPSDISWDTKQQGAFVNALATNARGIVFVGTEDNGLWRYVPQTRKWLQLTTKDGLASNRVYALACDKWNRIWIGTDSGLSVLTPTSNGGYKLTSYGVLDGLAGERVFAIATSPLNGEVWVGTNAGMTRYLPRNHSWQTISQANGLPADDVCAIAFAPDGTAYIGTQANGMAIASPTDNYVSWRKVNYERVLPLVPTAVNSSKLPTGLINDIRVLADGTICVATTTGLAASRDGGKRWNWLRGSNWAQKVYELSINGAPKDWKEPAGWRERPILSEDYLTTLDADAKGHLWAGYRQQGIELRDLQGNRFFSSNDDKNDQKPHYDYVKDLLPLADGSVLVASYGDGLLRLTAPELAAPTPQKPPTVAAPVKSASPATKLTPLAIPAPQAVAPPVPARVPTLGELNALLKSLSAVKVQPQQQQPVVTALPDDWRTQGTHLGRYGRYWMNLCAVSPPTLGANYIWGAGWEPVESNMRIGLNSTEGDSLRYWVHALYTDDPRSLEIPLIFLHSRVLKGLTNWNLNRRQAEADDHGEVYHWELNGPSIYATVKIPKGTFVFSIYNMNKDGHEGNNRFRDYTLSIRPHRNELNITQIKNFDQQLEWSRGRIRDFWGGVWKRFLVQGPTTFTVEVGRNYSLNTLLTAMTLDTLDEEPAPYFRTVEQQQALDQKREALRLASSKEPEAERLGQLAPATNVNVAADKLWTELQRQKITNSAWWALNSRRYYAPLARWYRTRLKSTSPKSRNAVLARLGGCYFALNMFEAWEKTQQARGLWTARAIERALRWNGLPLDERRQGLRFVNDFLEMKKELGLLANDPKNIEAEQTRQREELLAQVIENLRYQPPTADMMDSNGFLKPNVKLKERSPQEFARLKAKAEKYQSLN